MNQRFADPECAGERAGKHEKPVFSMSPGTLWFNFFQQYDIFAGFTGLKKHMTLPCHED
jgi:hypothetical protein